MEKIKVNGEQTVKIGQALKDFRIKEEYKNREFLTFQSVHEKKIVGYLFCAAICHQTYSLVNKSKNLVGWNYLEHVFSNLAKEDSNLLSIEYVSGREERELISEFGKLFPEVDGSERCTLDKLPERIALVKNIAEVVNSRFNGEISRLKEELEKGFSRGGNEVYEIMRGFKAFQDPLGKKSTLFLKLIYQSGLVDVQGYNEFKPLMDYHMQRLLLRSGCVEVLDMNIEEKLKKRQQIDSDEEIREKCIQAIEIISEVSGIGILDIDDIFWALGRSCCNNKVLCRDRECSKSPCTLISVIDLDEHERCLLEQVCVGKVKEDYQKFWEPNVRTNYY